MTMTEVDVREDERDHRKSLALLKAIGLDRVPPEQRELALAIAKRYELDLLLKHLVLVDGRPYITRDGLLHIAHRSGVLDGIEVSEPEAVDDFWRATASVYRKDMSRPFRYHGRYPVRGQNARYAPEMAVKVAEVMALRRAFDVSAPVIEERWDIDVQAPAEPEPTITEAIAAKRAALASPPHAAPIRGDEAVEGGTVLALDNLAGEASEDVTADVDPGRYCGARPPDSDKLGLGTCILPPGSHRTHSDGRGTWRDEAPTPAQLEDGD